MLDAVKRFAELMKYSSPGLYNATFPDILSAFISGRAVFGTFPGRMGVNLAAQNPELAESVTVVPTPAGPFMTGQLLFGGIQHSVVYAKTAHPEETLAFLEFMTTGERSLDYAMTVPGHLLPPLKSVRALVPSYQSEFMTKYGDWVITLNDLVPNAFSPALAWARSPTTSITAVLAISALGGAAVGKPSGRWHDVPADSHRGQDAGGGMVGSRGEDAGRVRRLEERKSRLVAAPGADATGHTE